MLINLLPYLLPAELSYTFIIMYDHTIYYCVRMQCSPPSPASGFGIFFKSFMRIVLDLRGPVNTRLISTTAVTG